MSWSNLRLTTDTHSWNEIAAMSTQSTEQSAGSIPRSLYGYDVTDFIGEGAGSMIYSAVDPSNNHPYALKHVAVKTDKDQRFVEQLVNEFEIGTKAAHPLLRRSVDLKLTKTLLRKITDAVLVMELVEGTSCETRPPTEVSKIIDIFHQTAVALAALHQLNFVHCDLKPNNILVKPDGRIKLIDLGQACPVGSVKKRIQGTPDFISPEQVRCEPVTFQTDIYHLGATFYWLLCKKKLQTLFTIKIPKQLPGGRCNPPAARAKPQGPGKPLQPGHGMRTNKPRQAPRQHGRTLPAPRHHQDDHRRRQKILPNVGVTPAKSNLLSLTSPRLYVSAAPQNLNSFASIFALFPLRLRSGP